MTARHFLCKADYLTKGARSLRSGSSRNNRARPEPAPGFPSTRPEFNSGWAALFMRSSKYRSREMPAVRRLFLTMKTGTAEYFGITTGRDQREVTDYIRRIIPGKKLASTNIEQRLDGYR